MSESLSDLEKQSFKNLTLFYEDEFRQVLSGVPATTILTIATRCSLRRAAVLVVRAGGPGRVVEITERARVVLADL